MDGKSGNLFMIINVIFFVRNCKYNVRFTYFSISLMFFLLWFHAVNDKNVASILLRGLNTSHLVGWLKGYCVGDQWSEYMKFGIQIMGVVFFFFFSLRHNGFSFCSYSKVCLCTLGLKAQKIEVIFLKIPWGHQWVRIDTVMIILYSAVVDLQYCKLNYLDCNSQPLLLTGPFTFFLSQGSATPCCPSPGAEKLIVH